MTNGLETKHPKMGFTFESPIPLMIKVTVSLVSKAVIWSTWNPSYNSKNGKLTDGFYKLQEHAWINL
jgi:hypothetical protein